MKQIQKIDEIAMTLEISVLSIEQKIIKAEYSLKKKGSSTIEADINNLKHEKKVMQQVAAKLAQCSKDLAEI